MWMENHSARWEDPHAETRTNHTEGRGVRRQGQRLVEVERGSGADSRLLSCCSARPKRLIACAGFSRAAGLSLSRAAERRQTGGPPTVRASAFGQVVPLSLRTDRSCSLDIVMESWSAAWSGKCWLSAWFRERIHRDLRQAAPRVAKEPVPRASPSWRWPWASASTPHRSSGSTR